MGDELRLRDAAPVRDVTSVGPGDYVKVQGGAWQQILVNTAHGLDHAPTEWTILTTHGATLGMYDAYRYAQAEDFRGSPRLNGPRFDVEVRRLGGTGALELDTAIVCVPPGDVTGLVALTLSTLGPADSAQLKITRRVVPRGD